MVITKVERRTHLGPELSYKLTVKICHLMDEVSKLLIFQRAAGKKGGGGMRDRMLWNTEQSCRNSGMFI